MESIKSATHKSGEGTVAMTEGDLGYIVTVHKEALPPHYTEEFDTRGQAEERFAELTKPTPPEGVTIFTDWHWNHETTLEERERILQEAMDADKRVWLHADGSMAIADEVDMANYAERTGDDDWTDHTGTAFVGLEPRE